MASPGLSTVSLSPEALAYLKGVFNKDDPAAVLQILEKISEMHFTGQPIPDENCKYIAEAVAFCGANDLKGFFVNDSEMSDAGFQVIADAFAKKEWPNFVYMGAYNNHIGDGGIAKLAEAVTKMPKLQNLHIYENKFTDEGFKALVKAFSESKLANFKELGMNGCPGVTDAGVAALAEACAGGALPALSLELRLGGATITEAGVTSLAKACEAGAFPKLKSLSLGNVSVSESCKEALKSAIAKTKMNVDLFAPAPVS